MEENDVTTDECFNLKMGWLKREGLYWTVYNHVQGKRRVSCIKQEGDKLTGIVQYRGKYRRASKKIGTQLWSIEERV